MLVSCYTCRQSIAFADGYSTVEHRGGYGGPKVEWFHSRCCPASRRVIKGPPRVMEAGEPPKKHKEQ